MNDLKIAIGDLVRAINSVTAKTPEDQHLLFNVAGALEGLDLPMHEQNPPAFPTVSNARPEHVGMSLRDYFAGQAMLAIFNLEDENDYDEIARHAYNQADAMLEARKVNDE